MNLMPGVISCPQALEAILSAIPIEAAYTMDYERTGPYALAEDPPVWADYRRLIQNVGLSLQLQPVEKWDFYKHVAHPDHVLTIQTADQQRYANLLLHAGVRM
jgi:L-fucose mutarotase